MLGPILRRRSDVGSDLRAGLGRGWGTVSEGFFLLWGCEGGFCGVAGSGSSVCCIEIR